jgi:hypothetical protein
MKPPELITRKFKIGFCTFTALVSPKDSIHILRPSQTGRDHSYVAVLDKGLQSQLDKLNPPVKVEGCFPREENIYRVAEIANGVSLLLERDPESLPLKELYAKSLTELRAEIKQHLGLDCLYGDCCLARNYYHLIAITLIGASCYRRVSNHDIYEVRLLAPYRVEGGLIFRFEGDNSSLTVIWDKIWSINDLELYLQNPHPLRGLPALSGWSGYLDPSTQES